VDSLVLVLELVVVEALVEVVEEVEGVEVLVDVLSEVLVVVVVGVLVELVVELVVVDVLLVEPRIVVMLVLVVVLVVSGVEAVTLELEVVSAVAAEVVVVINALVVLTVLPVPVSWVAVWFPTNSEPPTSATEAPPTTRIRTTIPIAREIPRDLRRRCIMVSPIKSLMESNTAPNLPKGECYSALLLNTGLKGDNGPSASEFSQWESALALYIFCHFYLNIRHNLEFSALTKDSDWLMQTTSCDCIATSHPNQTTGMLNGHCSAINSPRSGCTFCRTERAWEPAGGSQRSSPRTGPRAPSPQTVSERTSTSRRGRPPRTAWAMTRPLDRTRE